MKKRGLTALTVLCLAVLCLGYLARGGFVYANSAQRYWHGSSSAGSFTVDDNCPLEVEHEKLVFDIPQFPEHYGSDEESLMRYGAKVTAEYEFYNPADYDVTAKLVFPFGVRPSYIYPDIITAEIERYGITVNGENVEKTLRHTYKRSSGEFNIDEELPKIRDGYADDKFFAPDLCVTEYVYEFEKIDKSENYSPYAAFELKCGENTRVMISNGNGYSHEDNRVEVGLFVRDYDRVSVYAIGEQLSDEQLPEWIVYANGATEKKIEGRALLLRTEVTSFLEFVTEKHDESGDVSKVDWYNAAVDSINENDSYDGKYLGIAGFNLDYHLMRWYEYELNVKSGERITNAVTAPLYPTIDGGYEPPVYEYEYLTSPAKTWNKFGALDIEINTPYYMIDNGGLEFVKTDGGYKLSLSGLPENEIIFSLCEVEKPNRVKYSSVYTVLIVFGVLVIAGGLVALGAAVFAVVMIVGAYRKAHPKNKSDDVTIPEEIAGENNDVTVGEKDSDDENTIE